jgi:hypothetical protein
MTETPWPIIAIIVTIIGIIITILIQLVILPKIADQKLINLIKNKVITQ